VPQKPLPYGKQWISDEDIGSVVEVLRSEWLTTGPKVHEFEEAFAAVAGTREAVAVSNGTAALHCAMYALGIGPGDEVIVPAMTSPRPQTAWCIRAGRQSLRMCVPRTFCSTRSRSRAGLLQHQGGDRCGLRRTSL